MITGNEKERRRNDEEKMKNEDEKTKDMKKDETKDGKMEKEKLKREKEERMKSSEMRETEIQEGKENMTTDKTKETEELEKSTYFSWLAGEMKERKKEYENGKKLLAKATEEMKKRKRDTSEDGKDDFEEDIAIPSLVNPVCPSFPSFSPLMSSPRFIFPLIELTDEEVALYCALKGIPFLHSSSPSSPISTASPFFSFPPSPIRSHLENIEYANPGRTLKLFRGFYKQFVPLVSAGMASLSSSSPSSLSSFDKEEQEETKLAFTPMSEFWKTIDKSRSSEDDSKDSQRTEKSEEKESNETEPTYTFSAIKKEYLLLLSVLTYSFVHFTHLVIQINHRDIPKRTPYLIIA